MVQLAAASKSQVAPQLLKGVRFVFILPTGQLPSARLYLFVKNGLYDKDGEIPSLAIASSSTQRFQPEPLKLLTLPDAELPQTIQQKG
jgi:hypothetical protein